MEGCRAGLAEFGVDDVGFAPVPPDLIESIIRAQIEPSMAPDNQEWGTQHLPGLSQSVDGFTRRVRRILFAAAAGVRPRLAVDGARQAPPRADIVQAGAQGGRRDETHRVRVAGGIQGGGILRVRRAQDLGGGEEGVRSRHAATALGTTGSRQQGESVNGQSCMFASVYECPFEDVDDAERAGWDLAPMEDEPGRAILADLLQDGVREGRGRDRGRALLTRPAIVELQCFELALKAVAALIKSGDLRRADDENQSANDGKPWTVQCETFAGSAGSEMATIDVEVSLPSLDDSAANEGQDAYL